MAGSQAPCDNPPGVGLDSLYGDAFLLIDHKDLIQQVHAVCRQALHSLADVGDLRPPRAHLLQPAGQWGSAEGVVSDQTGRRRASGQSMQQDEEYGLIWCVVLPPSGNPPLLCLHTALCFLLGPVSATAATCGAVGQQ